MKAPRRGLENIRTLKGLVNRFQARTPHSALAELTRLKAEKERLCDEKKRWEKRNEQIAARLKEIEAMEQWLYRIANEGEAPPTTTTRKGPLDQRAEMREMTLKY